MKSTPFKYPSSLSPVELSEYEIAQNSSFFYVPANPAYLQIRGPDRIDFLQRQTTNDLRRLSPGFVLRSVLTSPNARIEDVLILLEIEHRNAGEPILGIVGQPGRGGQTYDYLKQRIFFMDKVSIENHSPVTVQIQISGPDAETLPKAIGFDGPPQPDHFLTLELEGNPVFIFHAGKFVGENYILIAPAGASEAIFARLHTGAIQKVSTPVHEVLRVETGLPGAEFELTERFTPLEVGLGDAISDSKGCYTGQEVIARQITYDKVTQHLVGIRPASPVEPGAAIWADGKRAGMVTSYVNSPTFGPIALGVVRRPHNEPGVEISVGETAPGVPARVTALPFIDDIH